jgi:protein required for attachment to host cells
VEVDRFARTLATVLGAHAAKGDFSRLVLAAPPKLLGRLRRHLGHAARRRVALELAHDYTALAPRELDGRLKDAERVGRARARRGAQGSAAGWQDL